MIIHTANILFSKAINRTLANSHIKFSSSSMELREVVKKLNSYAPTSLAEKWDNIGLLVEPTAPHHVKNMFLTNDLTPPVLEEAIQQKADMILAYHPPIFVPMKSMTQKTWKERIIVKCIENRIALYSPHTCYDCVSGGVNDWLISAFNCSSVAPITKKKELLKYHHKLIVSGGTDCISSIQQTIESHMWQDMLGEVRINRTDAAQSGVAELSILCSGNDMDFLTETCQRFSVDMEIYCLDKVAKPGYGSGRIGKISSDITIDEAINLVKKHLKLDHIRVAGDRQPDKTIGSVAVCAGSGSSVLNKVKADLLVTGEMSHHDVLDHVCDGRFVILCEHSNTERGFLTQLTGTLSNLLSDKICVIQSKIDADPLKIC